MRNHLSETLESAVKHHINHFDRNQNEIDDFASLEALPAHLRRRMLQEVRAPVLCNHAIFFALRSQNHRWYDRIACDAFQITMQTSGDVSFSVGEQCVKMYFSVSGQCVYFKHSRKILQCFGVCAPPDEPISQSQIKSNGRDSKLLSGAFELTSGDYICEPGLWCDWIHGGNFNALVPATRLDMGFDEFAKVVRSYPHLATWGRQHATRFVQALNLNERSDLFDTDLCMHVSGADAKRGIYAKLNRRMLSF